MIFMKISPNEAGQRLDKYLKKLLKDAPDSFIYKMLRKKNIILNGRKAEGREKLQPEDEIRFFLSEDTFEKFSRKDSHSDVDQYSLSYQKLRHLDILYEDGNTLVVNKPAGILSQKAKPEDVSVNEWLIGYMLSSGAIHPDSLAVFRPSICNRLDRNTSGMVICGKTLAGSQYLSRITREKSLGKYYHCVATGIVNIDKRITGRLHKDTGQNKVTLHQGDTALTPAVSAAEKGEFIDTAFRTLRTADGLTLLEARLFTGKTHQIRAQLASLGHPVIGDPKYGDEAVNRTYAGQGVDHQMLHACRLVFPVTSEPGFEQLSGRIIECPDPDIFEKLLCEPIY